MVVKSYDEFLRKYLPNLYERRKVERMDEDERVRYESKKIINELIERFRKSMI